MPEAMLNERNTKKIIIALALYLASLFAANTLGLKIMPFFFGLHVSVAVFFFPFVFLVTDVIGEVYGKKMAKLFVLAGFIATLLFVLYSFLSLALPWAAAGEWVHTSYDTVFGISLRIAIASVIAFIVGEYQDVISFFFFKARFGSRFFWLRSNLSNIWSQLLDTVLFMTIAFYGVYDNKTLVSIMVSWWLFKVVMGFLYTPLSYVGLWLLRDKEAA
ncbi:queuosine precursor transporter [Candidatus Kaiserbacteria bacterium]|nr:queuosine precursor transporter [Candidatus Kaiserbacteria bacterium]